VDGECLKIIVRWGRGQTLFRKDYKAFEKVYKIRENKNKSLNSLRAYN